MAFTRGSSRPTSSSRSSERPARLFDHKPYARSRSADRPSRGFDRKPYAGKPVGDRRTSRSGSERGLDPRQMRYQVIGRTTDESDLIVQISPAFYEYIRSMAHQGVKAPRVEEDKPRYSKYDHPFHKDPMHTSYEKKKDERPSYQKKAASIESWDVDTMDMSEIDDEMDDEYTMIKQGFANLKPKSKTSTTRSSKPAARKPARRSSDKR